MILCDPKKDLGYIVSKRALAVLEFLETCAGAPEPAISILFPKHYKKSLRILRGSGYMRRCWTPGQDALWVPARYPVPKTLGEYTARCALGWLAVRLTEAGGRIKSKYAVFPTGKEYEIAIYRQGNDIRDKLIIVLDGELTDLQPGSLYVSYPDLKERRLRDCLKKI